MSENLYKYRVYCEDDSKYEFIWLSENDPTPTTCPTNTSHTITTSLTTIIETRDHSEVTIKEEDIKSGGHYFLQSIQFDAIPDTTTTYIISFPININVISATMIIEEINRGDLVKWQVAPNTTIGAITNIVNIGATILDVSQTVTDNLDIGFCVKITDGVNTEYLGKCLLIDKENGQITVQIPTINSFSPLSPTYIQMTVKYVDLELGGPTRLNVAKSKIGTSHLPANFPIHCNYTNKSLTETKRFVAYIEYLF